MTKEQQIKQMMLAVPQKIGAYDGNSAGQHLYGEQRQQIAETLYNAGYRKIDENCTVITKDELEEYKRQAVKEFAEKLKERVLKFVWKCNIPECIFSDIIIDLLKEYKNE